MKNGILYFILLLFTQAINAQKEFTIWPAAAPGSETWKWQEQTDSTDTPGDPLVYNTVKPALIYFPADPSIANGTSVIVCPGGSFSYLHIKTEGIDVAKWLNKKGVSVFVLKYRLVHSETNHPMKEKMERSKDTVASRKLAATVVPLAIADAKQAIVYLRKHADEFSIAPGKIGIMGFSAGGTLATATIFGYTNENRPDFAAPIYAYVPPSIITAVSKEAPPIFIAAATDDEYHLVPMSINLYSTWLAAGRSAELHIYSKGGHGFGMNKLNQPSDTWIDRFGDWLQLQGLLNK